MAEKPPSRSIAADHEFGAGMWLALTTLALGAIAAAFILENPPLIAAGILGLGLIIFGVNRHRNMVRFVDASDTPEAGESGQRNSDELVKSLLEKTELLVDLEKVRDDLERRNAELDRARQVAIEANQVKSEFLANMSHEIRTPMTAILGFADLLDELDADSSQRRDFARTIRRNGEHLLAILNDILDLSKVEAGQLSCETTPFELRSIIEDIQDIFEPRGQDKNLEVSFTVTDRVPRQLMSDPTRFRQILCNLIANAIKFTRNGFVRVTLDHDPDREILECEVMDSGIGIARESQNRIFEPFRQADGSTTRQHGGTGLGLHISRRLAKLLGGDLKVDSMEGRGSRFTLEIPCVANEQPADNPVCPEGTTNGQPKLSGARILLADDGADNRRLISHFLSMAGATTHEEADGQAALDTLLKSRNRQNAFDLVILDVQMPRLDGHETARALREAGWNGPILALTANAMQGDREDCLNAGCDDYLSKPIRKDTLLASISRLLDERSPAQATG